MTIILVFRAALECVLNFCLCCPAVLTSKAKLILHIFLFYPLRQLVMKKLNCLFKLRTSATKNATLLDGQGSVSSGIYRLFLFFYTHLEIKGLAEQIILVLPNFFSPGIFLEIFNLPNLYFRRNIKKSKLTLLFSIIFRTI